MASLEVPFDANEINGLMNKIVYGNFKPIPKLYSMELSNFINSMLQKDPKNRPSSVEILEMPAIKKIQDYVSNRHGHIFSAF